MAPKVICITNQKGGVGKTTTAITLGHGLSLAGKSVLLVDFDPQANCTISLNVKPAPGAFYLLTMGTGEAETEFLKQYVCQTGRERLRIIPGSNETNAAQSVISAQGKPITLIRDALARFTRNGLDYMILDTAPSVGGIHERAIWASHMVIIPTKTEMLSRVGVKETLRIMVTLRKEKDWKGGLLGILPTFYNRQEIAESTGLEDLKNAYGDMIMPPIHKATVMNDCPALAQTIFELDPRSRPAQEYSLLVKKVLERT